MAERRHRVHTRVNEQEFMVIQSLFTEPIASDSLRSYLLDQATHASDHRLLMAEVLALRSIVLNVLAALAPDQAAAIQRMADYQKTERAKAMGIA